MCTGTKHDDDAGELNSLLGSPGHMFEKCFSRMGKEGAAQIQESRFQPYRGPKKETSIFGNFIRIP